MRLPPAALKVRCRRAYGAVVRTIEPSLPAGMEVRAHPNLHVAVTAQVPPACGAAAPGRRPPRAQPPLLPPAAPVPARPLFGIGRAASRRVVMLPVVRRRVISAAASVQAPAIALVEVPPASAVQAWPRHLAAWGALAHSEAEAVLLAAARLACLRAAASVAVAVAVVIAKATGTANGKRHWWPGANARARLTTC